MALLAGLVVLAAGAALLAGPLGPDGGSAGWAVVGLWRAPRVVGALIAGSALALAGAVVQTVFRNPLSGPDVLGWSAGASLGVLLLLRSGLTGLEALGAPLAALGAPLAALAGTAAALGLTRLAARTLSSGGPLRLLLAGLVWTAFSTSLTTLVLYTSKNYQLAQFLFWTVGSLGGRSWEQVLVGSLLWLPGLVWLVRLAPRLNALLLGDDAAQAAGASVRSLRRQGLVCAALLTAASVTIAGPLPFLGLLAPLALRQHLGSRLGQLLPAAGLTGALVVLSADTLGRSAFGPWELPAGLLLSLLGAPLFWWLLSRRPYGA